MTRALRPFALGLSCLAGAALVSLPAGSAWGAADASDEPASESDANAEKKGGEAESEKSADDAAKGDADKQDSKAEKPAEGDAMGHKGQVGLRLGVVGGLAMVVRYEKSTFCRAPDDPEDLASLDDEPKFCGHVAPFALDLGLSFALADSLEPFIWARLGLGGEEQTDTNPLIVVGAGVRLYSMSDSIVKVLIEPAVGVEFEDGQGNYPWSLATDGYSTDIVFHVAAGPQFDFARYIGLYITGGLTAGVIRSVHTTLDLQVGLQGRYP